MDTTGQVVMQITDNGAMIAEDLGWYKGTIEAYNVRKIRAIKTYSGMGYKTPVVMAIIDTRAGYGCTRGAGSMLYPVTADDIAALDAAVVAKGIDTIEADLVSARGLTLSQEMDREDTVY